MPSSPDLSHAAGVGPMEAMAPLEIVAHLRGSLAVHDRGPQLDTMLAHAIATRRGLPPPRHAEDITPIEVPLARSSCGRYYQCSVGFGRIELTSLDWTNRRFPIERAMRQADPADLRVINVKMGAQKSYRLPRERHHLEGDRMAWWCVGDHEAISGLLADVTHIGRRRAVGLGEVERWTISTMRLGEWAGFPVLRDGRPLRPLPLDTPGVDAGAARGFAVLADPARGVVSWARHREEELWMPQALV